LNRELPDAVTGAGIGAKIQKCFRTKKYGGNVLSRDLGDVSSNKIGGNGNKIGGNGNKIVGGILNIGTT